MKVEVVKGDITKESVDAIVNAANKALKPGGGVDGAITLAAGSNAMYDRLKIGGCNTGDAVIGSAGNLDAKYIIYTVGPRWTDNTPILLKSAYRSSMKLAIQYNCKSIAFPAISAGVYGFPVTESAKSAFDALTDFEDADILVKFVMFTDDAYNAFRAKFE